MHTIITTAEFGEEAVIYIGNGSTLRTNAGAVGEPTFGGHYVRVVGSDGEEIGFWDHAEWRDDPQVVMGAIFGAASGIVVEEPA